MKIRPTQQYRPSFKMKWTQRQLNQTKLTKILLNNGNRLAIRETPDYKLQTLYDKFNNWVKSKLKYFNENKIIRSQNNDV